MPNKPTKNTIFQINILFQFLTSSTCFKPHWVSSSGRQM